MSLSAFGDKSNRPGDDDLARVLGDSFVLWKELKRLIITRFDPITIEWGFASKSSGWTLRLKKEKRTILYMIPCKGYFLTSFALGEKAVKAAHDDHMPDSVLNIIDSAKKYAEGRAVLIEVRTIEGVRDIEKLAMIKMAY